MSKRKTVSKTNTVDLGALQANCEVTSVNLRDAQDAKIQADRDFAEARDEYLKAGKALELGMQSVINRCQVVNLLGK